MRIKPFLFIVLIVLLNNSISISQNSPSSYKLNFQSFFDYFYYLNSSNNSLKDSSGFQFRRIHLTGDFAIDKDFSARLRLESEQNNGFSTGSKFSFLIKDAYLKWGEIFSGSTLTVGLSPTPAWQLSEKAWRYRSVEKTVMDLFSIVNSRDLGIDLAGRITSDGVLNYWIKIGNNSNLSIESDKDRKYYAQIQFKPTEAFQASLYFDYAELAEIYDLTELRTKTPNKSVIAVFLNYEIKDSFGAGIETFYVTSKNNFRIQPNQPLQGLNGTGVSMWGWKVISEKISVLMRFDSVNPNDKINNDGTNLFIAGLEYRPTQNISVIPNIELFNYSAAKNNDLIARLTFACTF